MKKERFKQQRELADHQKLPHGMTVGEFKKLTASRCGNAGYVRPGKEFDEEGNVVDSTIRMRAFDKNSKTQKRKANRTKDGDTSKYGSQDKHKMRRDGRGASGNRRRVMKHSKRQVLRTCGEPFDHTEGFVTAPGNGRPSDPK